MVESEDSPDASPGGRRSKVARLVERYGLSDVGAELEARWTGEGREREGLRDLAERFNRQLLRARMEESGIDAIDEELDTIYRVLASGEGIDSGSRTQLRRRLERDGLDVDDLESDFVSRQAVHTYLTRVRGVEHRSESDDPLERDRRTIRRLVSRTENVTTDKLERLRTNGDVGVGEFRVTADVRVLCTDCGTQLGVDELLQGEECSCPR